VTSVLKGTVASPIKRSRFPSFKIKSLSAQSFSHVNVEFLENLTINQVTQHITYLFCPHVIIWYIGCKGLRSNGVQFYRDYFIGPLISLHPEVTLWLMDLTAWGAFKTPQCKVHNFSSSCSSIDSLDKFGIKCIKSSKIFDKMQKLSSEEIINYFKFALARDFISKSSLQHANVNIRTGDIFGDQCPIINEYYNYDASKSYSILQYLEGCFLVEEIFLQQMANQKSDIEIVFALPNNELDYYRDENQSFQCDVQFLIERICKENGLRDVKINIKFLGFKYGVALSDRPYNAPGKVLKNNKLSYEEIVGNVLNKESKSLT
jgi:hypothetical protein